VTIVTSEYLRDECRKDFGVEAQIARMGGMEIAGAFRVRRVEAGEPLRMLSVCRIEGNKRIDWMLEALAELERGAGDAAPLSARVDWRLDLAGKGPLLEELQARAEALGLGERVRFHGFVPDAELERMYAEAHLFLMPAVQGYGIPAVESLNRGIPVLLHRESGVSDILLDTPWATVLHGGREEMTAKLREAVDGVLAGRHAAVPLPAVPTEDAWAERVARLCGWVK
jgi:glycosyltransferase involved in cell wall biosynthesis